MDIIPQLQRRANCYKEVSKSQGLKLPLIKSYSWIQYNALPAKEGKLLQVF